MKIFRLISWFLPGGFFCPGVGAAVIGAGVLGAGGAIYSADQARKASNTATDAAKQANELALMPLSSGASSINRRAGTVSLDPSIRALRDSTLANIPGYRSNLNTAYGDFSGRLGSIYGGLQGNQSPFIQARVNPLLQQQAQQTGQLQTSLGMRGLSGSSFGDQALTNLNTDYGRAIGDQAALATQDTLNAQTGVAGQMFNAAGANNQQNMALDTSIQGTAGQDLAQELSALGLAPADIGAILNSGVLAGNAGQNYASNIGQSIGSMGNLFTGLSKYQYPGLRSPSTSPQYGSGMGGSAYGGTDYFAP
jgi:hypothetical protein